LLCFHNNVFFDNSIYGSNNGTGSFSGSDSKQDAAFDSATWSWDNTNYLYKWAGDFEGFSRTLDPANIQSKVSDKNSDFAKWVTSIDPDGFKKDARGQLRGNPTWPGAYGGSDLAAVIKVSVE
jgi:hypothetical protein